MAKSLDAADLLKLGGGWLGSVRAWMQMHKHNGSSVTWSSLEPLVPPVTVKEVEEIGAHAAVAAINDSNVLRSLRELLEVFDDGLLVPKKGMGVGEEFRLGQTLNWARHRAKNSQ